LNSNNALRHQIISKIVNLKSDSNEKELKDITADAEALVKPYIDANKEINEKSNTIKIQILIQAVLTLKALLSTVIFAEIDNITAVIRKNKIKPTLDIIALADATYDTAYTDANSALKFSLNRINSLKDKSDEDVLKHKNLLDLIVMIFKIRLNQMKDVVNKNLKATSDDAIRDKLKKLQNNVNEKLIITEKLLQTEPFPGPVDKPSLESFKQKLNDILNGITQVLSSLEKLIKWLEFKRYIRSKNA
jgi:hypothetical protein